jgi:hypothetical protein
MIRVVVIFLGLIVGGCYTNMTSVFSSYDLKPRERVERQPNYLFEASPHLELGGNILVGFNTVPGRSISPKPETCEQAITDKIDILLYSNSKYLLELSKVEIRAEDKVYHLKSYRTYGNDIDVEVISAPLLPVGFMPDDFSEFKKTVNHIPNQSYDRYVQGRGIVAGTTLKFDGLFSCGENHYEMDLWFLHSDSGKSEKYTINFFPWKSTITPH